jgi:hypothetical protein
MALLVLPVAQAQVGVGLRARAIARDDMTKMIGATAVPAFSDLRKETARGQSGGFLERLANKGQERTDLGGTRRVTDAQQTGLR